jgi:phage terminase large subunit-like protein
VPEEAVKTRTVRGSVPYQSWVESGYIEQTKGDVIDHNVIAAAIIEANERFDIRGIGYDQWNAAQLVAKLEAENVPMQMFIQGPKVITRPCRNLSGLIFQGISDTVMIQF